LSAGQGGQFSLEALAFGGIGGLGGLVSEFEESLVLAFLGLQSSFNQID